MLVDDVAFSAPPSQQMLAELKDQHPDRDARWRQKKVSELWKVSLPLVLAANRTLLHD